MKSVLFAVAGLLALSVPAHSGDRYAIRPPVVVSPDLSAPWVMQLGQQPGRVVRRAPRPMVAQPRPVFSQPRAVVAQPHSQRRIAVQPRAEQPGRVQAAAFRAPKPMYTKKEVERRLDPKFLPQQVAYDGPGKPGDIVIDSASKFLFLVQANGKARRYGVGVGKEGFGWAGTNPITRKAEWPGWTPPAEMIARERRKGRVLPAHMEGGPANPLGARALYLGDTLYRIHGTNAPWTIGTNVSSGCIRMRNEDVIDLYERVAVGTKVIVL
jgi:lipoprotein-anchoring transpeptidase ErfK/SrfK